MKKVIALFIAFMLLIVCSACSNQDDSSDSAGSGAVAPAVATKVPRFASVAVGDVITFGTYEQDNNPDNGPEPIEWVVLDVKDHKALVISKEGLDAIPYSTEQVDVSWETCSLRSWLNNEFISAAFTQQEQSAVLPTDVNNNNSQGYDNRIPGGNNTKDKVFLLNFQEASGYFPDDNSRTCFSTAYAVANGADTGSAEPVNGRQPGTWWLRSPGNSQDRAARVATDGAIIDSSVSGTRFVVRPVFWLDLDSGI